MVVYPPSGAQIPPLCSSFIYTTKRARAQGGVCPAGRFNGRDPLWGAAPHPAKGSVSLWNPRTRAWIVLLRLAAFSHRARFVFGSAQGRASARFTDSGFFMGRRSTPRQGSVSLWNPRTRTRIFFSASLLFLTGRASALVPLGDMIPPEPCSFATLAGMKNRRPQTPVMQTGSISNTPLFASIQAAQTPHRARISTGTRHGAPGRNRASPLPRAPAAR